MLNKSCQLLLRRMLFVQDNMLKSNAIRNTSLYMETKTKTYKNHIMKGARISRAGGRCLRGSKVASAGLFLAQVGGA